ncbi:MAG: RraA family protein [Pseudomonadota bacterium]
MPEAIAEGAVKGRIGLRMRTEIPRPPAATIAALAACGSDLVADGMNRFGVMGGAIKPLKPGWRLAGPAVTVRVRAADNLMVNQALGLARPGDVLVVATGRHVANAIWGELMALAAMKQGLSGLVTDGAVRDRELLLGLDFPVFAAAVTAAACDKDGPGEINFPVAVGDVAVMPGDIVIADDDGVIVVPMADVGDVMAGIAAKRKFEAQRRADIEAGRVVTDAVAKTVSALLG